MKALSVRNPFATDIMGGEKEFEFRTWQTDYRGDLLICSSANPKIKNTICGHALCIVRLNDVIKVTPKNYRDFGLDADEKPEAGEKLYAWQLTDVRIINPFPVKGKLNFFEVNDEKIEIFDDGSDTLTEEEVDKWFTEVYEPLMYTGRK